MAGGDGFLLYLIDVMGVRSCLKRMGHHLGISADFCDGKSLIHKPLLDSAI
jgi:hypothetical protein